MKRAVNIDAAQLRAVLEDLDAACTRFLENQTVTELQETRARVMDSAWLVRRIDECIAQKMSR